MYPLSLCNMLSGSQQMNRSDEPMRRMENVLMVKYGTAYPCQYKKHLWTNYSVVSVEWEWIHSNVEPVSQWVNEFIAVFFILVFGCQTEKVKERMENSIESFFIDLDACNNWIVLYWNIYIFIMDL